MKRFNLSSPADFMALAVRRKWWIIVPFVALSCTALLLTSMLPKMYVSSALVLIQSRDLPRDFVKDLISGSTEQRVSRIEQLVLRRENLDQILGEFEADFPEYRGFDQDLKRVKLRKQVSTEFKVETQIGKDEIPLTYFRVSFRSRNPAVAQKIAEKLTGLFIQEDTRQREKQVVGTTSFLADALTQVKEKLAASDTKLKTLKTSRRGSLPEQLTANLSMLGSLVDQRKANLESRDRWVTELANVERDMAATPPTLILPKPSLVVKVARNPLLDDYLAAKAALKALVADGKKESHPDVIKTTNQLERIKKQLTSEELESLDRPVENSPAVATEEYVQNPAYRNLINRKESIETELRLRDKAVASTDAEIEKINLRIQNSPQSEQDISDAVRENLDLFKQHQDLNAMLTTSRLSESAESTQKGSQFLVVDPANYPLDATKPNKPTIAIAGVLLSLLAGIAIGVVVDLANQKMWTLSDVEVLLGAPVLVEIPEIITPADLKTRYRTRNTHIAVLAALSAVYGVCLYLIYTHQSGVLNRIDPLIMRLY